MKRFLCSGILAASMVAAYVYAPERQPVYSINIYSGGWSSHSVFHLGTPPCNLGVSVDSAIGFPGQSLKPDEVKSFTNFEMAGRVFRLAGDLSPWVRGTGYVAATFGLTCCILMFFTPRPKLE